MLWKALVRMVISALSAGHVSVVDGANVDMCLLDASNYSKFMHNDALREFNCRFIPHASPAAWQRLLDSDVAVVGGTRRTLKSILTDRVLVPFETSVSNPSFGAAYSAILFGPPGTAKTTIHRFSAQLFTGDMLE